MFPTKNEYKKENRHISSITGLNEIAISICGKDNYNCMNNRKVISLIVLMCVCTVREPWEKYKLLESPQKLGGA